jgi:pimeloyl-ACP methyl ester carboxylesterase
MARKSVLGLAALGLGIAATAYAYARGMAAARARISACPSAVVPTRFGPLHYAAIGEGPPVLMIHGAGGGFDQALFMARPLVEAGYRVIAPCRFGYLGSPLPRDPSSENQADAFVDLLDHLGLDRVAVCGGSAGAASALHFAIRHPERCASLLALVPAAQLAGHAPLAPWTPSQRAFVRAVLASDFLFWAAMQVMPDAIVATLFATDPALLKAAGPGERDRLRGLFLRILPVSQRAEGLVNDERLTGEALPAGLGRIAAPTLALSLEDDRYGTADVARQIAALVPGARLVVYPTGGHVWIGRNEEVFATIDGFLREADRI